MSHRLRLALLAFLLLSGSLAACQHDGPAERAGKTIDRAGERVRDAVDRATD